MLAQSQLKEDPKLARHETNKTLSPRIVAVMAIVGLIILAAGSYYLVMSSNSTSPSKNTSTNTSTSGSNSSKSGGSNPYYLNTDKNTTNAEKTCASDPLTC